MSVRGTTLASLDFAVPNASDFVPGQVWASFDEDDLPCDYAIVDECTTEGVLVRWLEAVEDDFTRYVLGEVSDGAVPFACFSHRLDGRALDSAGQCVVVPRPAEVWAFHDSHSDGAVLRLALVESSSDDQSTTVRMLRRIHDPDIVRQLGGQKHAFVIDNALQSVLLSEDDLQAASHQVFARSAEFTCTACDRPWLVSDDVSRGFVTIFILDLSGSSEALFAHSGAGGKSRSTQKYERRSRRSLCSRMRCSYCDEQTVAPTTVLCGKCGVVACHPWCAPTPLCRETAEGIVFQCFRCTMTGESPVALDGTPITPVGTNLCRSWVAESDATFGAGPGAFAVLGRDVYARIESPASDKALWAAVRDVAALPQHCSASADARCACSGAIQSMIIGGATSKSIEVQEEHVSISGRSCRQLTHRFRSNGVRLGVSILKDVLTEPELMALERDARKLANLSTGAPPQFVDAPASRRRKVFYRLRYVNYEAGGTARLIDDVPSDVPDGILEAERVLSDVLGQEVADMLVLNCYKRSGIIGVHKDPELFDRPIVSIRCFGSSTLTFGASGLPMMNGLFRIPLHRGDVLKMSGLATDLFSHCIRASDHSDALSASLMLRTLTAEGRDQLRALNQEQFKTVGRAVADEPAIREHGEFVRMEFDVGLYNGRVVAVAGDRYRVIYEDGDGEELDHADFVAAAQCFREARACGAVVEVDNLATAALYRKRDAFLVDD